MQFSLAISRDLPVLIQHDKHISRQRLVDKIHDNQVYVFREGQEFIGWLRWGLFWDLLPFLNMLYFLEPWRGKGYGTQAMAYWEEAMKKQGYSTLLTSTGSDETAQHFYTKLGYKAVGSFSLLNDPLELIFAKTITG